MLVVCQDLDVGGKYIKHRIWGSLNFLNSEFLCTILCLHQFMVETTFYSAAEQLLPLMLSLMSPHTKWA